MTTLNTFAASIRASEKIVVFTGAGISTESGIPDFRSPGGIWTRYRPIPFQEYMTSEAARVVAIENRMQAVGPAFLTDVRIGRRSFTLRELQPSADKLDLSTTHPDRAAFEAVIAAMGELTAWAQLRCAGRDGATNIDGLMAFARNAGWSRPLIALAKDWAAAIYGDWRRFADSELAAWAEAQTGLARRV